MALQDWGGAPSSDPAQVFLWDVDQWAEAWRREASTGCATMEFSPDGGLIAYGVYAGGMNAHIIVHLRDAQEGRPEAGVVDFYDASDLAFSPDGHYLAATNGYVLLYKIASMRRFLDNVLDDVGTDTPAQILKPQSGNGLAEAAEFSPTESLLALTTREGSLLLWPLEDPSPTITHSTSDSCHGDPPEHARPIAFSSDGAVIATNLCGDSLTLYDAKTLTQVAAIPVSSPTVALAFAPDGARVLAAHDHGALIWDIPSNSVACVLDTRSQSPVAVGFARDGSRALATTREGAAIQWDLASCGPK